MSNCRRNEVNPAISVKGTTPDKNRVTTTTANPSFSKNSFIMLKIASEVTFSPNE